MYRYFAILVAFTISHIAIAREPLGLTDTPEYRELCFLAATDDAMFNAFKRDTIYKEIFEPIQYEHGYDYLKLIRKNYPDLIAYWDKFAMNDSIGSPRIYFYTGLGYASPTTLRYAKIAGEIRELFGDLSGKSIVEVGSGYGGQCKILTDLFPISSYLLIDIPEAQVLAARYLAALDVKNVHLTTPDETSPQSSDLFISNYSFGQCSRNTQEAYIKNYILKSSAGYMIINTAKENMAPKSISLMELRARLMKNGFRVKLFAEDPLTHKKNLLITWKKN